MKQVEHTVNSRETEFVLRLLFLHGVSHHIYVNLRHHYMCNGVTPRRHGNVGRSPKHALSLARATLHQCIPFHFLVVFLVTLMNVMSSFHPTCLNDLYTESIKRQRGTREVC